MIKCLAVSIITALASAQNCAICWDGTQAVYENNACKCPAASPDVVEPGDDTPLEVNPNCTTGNARACNSANGFFDYVSCTCQFPAQPGNPFPGNETPSQSPDQEEEEEEEQLKEVPESIYFEYERLNGVNRAFGITTAINLLFASTWSSEVDAMYGQQDTNKKLRLDSPLNKLVSKAEHSILGQNSKNKDDTEYTLEEMWYGATGSNTSFWSYNLFLWGLNTKYGWLTSFHRFSVKWSLPWAIMIWLQIFAVAGYEEENSKQKGKDVETVDEELWSALFFQWTIGYIFFWRYRSDILDLIELRDEYGKFEGLTPVPDQDGEQQIESEI